MSNTDHSEEINQLRQVIGQRLDALRDQRLQNARNLNTILTAALERQLRRATELEGLLRECKKVMKANSLFRNSVTHNDLSKRISSALNKDSK